MLSGGIYIAYAEGLLLAAAAACLLCVRRERWLLAILFANVACLSKESRVALVVAVAAEALRPGRTTRARIGIVAAAAASSLTFIGFGVYGWARTGHPLAFVSAEHDSNGKFVWFETPFKVVWSLLTSRDAWYQVSYVVAGRGFVLVVVGFVYLVRLHRLLRAAQVRHVDVVDLRHRRVGYERRSNSVTPPRGRQ